MSLERAANIAILALVPICAASWIYYFVATPTARAGAPAPPRYAQGDSLGDVAELASLPAAPMAVLFLNSHCRFCTENMPFYGRLLQQTRSRGTTLRTVVVAREPMTSLKAYIEGHALQPDDVVALADNTTFKQATTPALMLVDARRRIDQIWFGVVPASAEPILLDEVARFPGAAAGAVTEGSK